MLPELRQLAGKPVALQSQLQELRRRPERSRHHAGELVVRQVHLLQRPHASEGLVGDLAGEPVAGQVERLQGAEPADVGDGPGEAVAGDAKAAQVGEDGERFDVDDAGEAHPLQLQAPEGLTDADHAGPARPAARLASGLPVMKRPAVAERLLEEEERLRIGVGVGGGRRREEEEEGEEEATNIIGRHARPTRR